MTLSSTSPYGLLRRVLHCLRLPLPWATGTTPFFVVVPIISDHRCGAMSQILIARIKVTIFFQMMKILNIKTKNILSPWITKGITVNDIDTGTLRR